MVRFRPRVIAGWLVIFCMMFFLHNLLDFGTRVHITQLDFLFEDSNYYTLAEYMKKCRVKRSELGTHIINLNEKKTLKYISKANPEVETGGSWSPKDCEPWQQVAIVIPYRDRAHHLRLLLNRLHPMLRKQKIAYQIFVVEQAGTEPFNKGRLFNAAFIEINRLGKFDCFILHDVDLLPETDENIYMCDAHARHLSPAIDELKYHPPYYNIYGGVVALTYSNYQKVNGFPNRYSGWGGEDDEMSLRTYGAGLILTRPPYEIGRYKMAKHIKSTRSSTAMSNLYQWRYWWPIDGLSNMNDIKYSVLSVKKYQLYTHVYVDVGAVPLPPRDDIPKEYEFWFRKFFTSCSG